MPDPWTQGRVGELEDELSDMRKKNRKLRDRSARLGCAVVFLAFILVVTVIVLI